MNLKNANIKRLYFLDSEHPYKFYSQLYNHASQITVALGYFSGSAFGLGIDGLLNFLEKEGTLRILCNDKLYAPDLEAIAAGYEAREANPITIFEVANLISNADEYEIFGFKCLSYLIEVNRLDIKIVRSNGLVHFKIGYATDSKGNAISFEGSVNYTLSGLMLNHEQLHTTLSWKNEDDCSFVDEVKCKIEDLWNENIDGYKIINGNEIKDLIKAKFPTRDIEDLKYEYSLLKEDVIKNVQSFKVSQSYKKNTFFNFPENLKPRDYQVEAILNWESHDYQSLFAMATGTGKTLTALFAINALHFIDRSIDTILIIVPLKDLVDQWLEDIGNVFPGRIIKIRSGVNWLTELRTFKITNISTSTPLILISTYNSFSRHSKTILKLINIKNTVIIADEVHRFGSESLQQKLPYDIRYRIGLSATPKREYDEDGTKAIFDYFCPHEQPFEISIEDAIDLDVLCKYYYYPVFVQLTEDELREYGFLSDKIRKIQLSINNKDKKKKSKIEKDLTLILKQRHRIIEQARNKLNCFEELVEKLISDGEKINKAVLYAPEGVQDEEAVISQYTKNLYKKHRIMVAKYIQGTSKSILDDFSEGRIDILAAKKRLDEGVNIPSIAIAFFLASSTVEREFVQRRGRILRKHPDKKYAKIYDFLIGPPETYDVYLNDKDVKSLVKAEIKRAEIFAKNAENHFYAMRLLDEKYY